MAAYDDLDRPPLRAPALARGLVVPGGLWTRVDVLATTGSTNADVRAAASAGAGEGLVVVAEEQTAGRGRLGRQWAAPARSGLTFSVLLRPAQVPAAHWGWLPLLTGVAVASALRRVAGVEAALKWPNDVLVGEAKLAGVLVERVEGPPAQGVGEPGDRPSAGRSAGRPGAAAVVGVGLNVSLRADELPVPTATSLLLADAGCLDRDPVLRAVLRELAAWYAAWRAAGGDADRAGLRPAYRSLCATLGREVRMQLPGGGGLTGKAEDVDETGRLVVRPSDGSGPAGGRTAVAAGDVVHLR